MPRFIPVFLVAFLASSMHLPGQGTAIKPVRLGIIGLDTSHVDAFTKVINGSVKLPELRRLKVVAAYPAGSPDLPISRDRIQGFTKTLKERDGVEIVDSIEALLGKVDAVLLESVDGRVHLEQVKPVLKAGKPVFIDKPMACSLADVLAIADLAEKEKVPVFSCSSFRFAPQLVQLKQEGKAGEIKAADVYGPCPLMNPQFPDLHWYGIHGIEALYTIMGPGCETVTRTKTELGDVVTGVWKDGRVATFRGLRGSKTDYGFVAFGTKAIVAEKMSADYTPLLKAMGDFFPDGKAPVAMGETIEILTFLEAAHESSRKGGLPVRLADVLAQARNKKP